jgi:hypothetical protein
LSEDIQRIIRRDLDRLPLFPEERWLPSAASRTDGATDVVRTRGLSAALVVVVITAATLLVQARDQAQQSAGLSALENTAASRAEPVSNNPVLAQIVSRRSVLTQVRGLTIILARAQRFEAKLVSSTDVGGGAAVPPGTLWWVVAVSGDVSCSFCLTPPHEQPKSAVFWIDAHSGSLVASEQGAATWPDGFSALPDRSSSLDALVVAGSIREVKGNVIEFEAAGSSAQLRLIADDNTAYGWTAGPTSGSAITLMDLPLSRTGDGLVAVTIDRVPQPDGSYRLHELIIATSK